MIRKTLLGGEAVFVSWLYLGGKIILYWIFLMYLSGEIA
jgi:hypothetical protein